MAVSSDSNPTQVVGNLVGAIRSLTSDENYKLVADVFNEVLVLKQQNERLQASQREMLEGYRLFRNDLEGNLNQLGAEKTKAETALAETEKKLDTTTLLKLSLEEDLAENQRRVTELEKQKREVEEVLTSTKTELEAELKHTHEKLDETEEDLKATRSRLEEELNTTRSTLEEEIKTVNTKLAETEEAFQTTKTKLEEELKETQTRLQEEIDIVNTQLVETEQTFQTTKAKLEEDLRETQTKLDEVEARRTTLETDLAQANSKIEELEHQAAASQEAASVMRGSLEARDAEIRTLRDAVASTEEKVIQASKAADELRDHLAATQTDLADKSSRLSDLESLRIVLKTEPEDNYVAILDTIWTSIFELVESHFKLDLEDAVLADPSCWTNLRTSEYLKRPTQIPLPHSNSPAAKAMRIAAVLSILSRTLHKYIFRPVYLDHGDSSDDALSTLLRDLEAEDPRRELHLRATLLATLPERQLASARKRIQAVVRDVSWVVQHLLSALRFDSFCTGLGNACALACTQWRRIQEASMKIEPYFGPPFDEFDWQMLPLVEFEGEEVDEDADVEALGLDGMVNGDAVELEGTTGVMETAEVEEGAPVAELPEVDATPEIVIQEAEAEGDCQDESRTASNIDADDIDHDDPDDSAVTDTEASELDPDDILLVVWPSMCAVEGGELSSITQGLVITKTQARAAFHEAKATMGPRPASRKSKARTMSIPSHSVGGSPVPAKAFLVSGGVDGVGG